MTMTTTQQADRDAREGACSHPRHQASTYAPGLRLSEGDVVHVTTTNGGAADYEIARCWAGPSYSLLVRRTNGREAFWIGSERLATVTHTDCGRTWQCQ